MQSKMIKQQSFTNLLIAFGGLFIVLLMIYSYVSTEILTNTYLTEITNKQELCVLDSSKIKFYKITKFEKFRKTAKLLCIYENSSYNRQLELNYNNGWSVIVDDKLNGTRSFYWPMYF